jgi:uncharacterized protein with HEPN domain
MSERADRDSLSDIQEAIRRIGAYTMAMDYRAFLADFRTQDAVIRNLEIVGEATKNLSVEMRDRFPEVPWKAMAGVRDRLIHHYFGVNLDIVWQIVAGELPQLALQIEEIMQNEQDDE